MTTTLTERARLVVAGMRGDYPLADALAGLRDALEAHETRDGFASTCWSVDDILGLRPHLTEEAARTFLAGREGLIQDAMVQAGWEAIETLLDEDEL